MPFFCRLTIVLALVMLPAVAVGQAQQMRRIGVLGNLPPTVQTVLPLWQNLLDGLRERGWEEGRNLIIEGHWPEGRSEKIEEYAAELVARSPDVILTSNSQNLEALRRRTSTIPIVFAGISHPVQAGFVASLAQPGGNITGVSNQLDLVMQKQIEFLKELKPGMERVGILYAPSNPASALSAKWMLEEFAPQQGIAFEAVPLDTPAQTESAFTTIARAGVQALQVHPTGVAGAKRKEIAAFAIQHGLPTVTGNKYLVREGLLLFYGADEVGIWRQAAGYIDRILRGVKPSDLPVELPTKYELVINLATARALTLAVPSLVMSQADEVIE